MRSCAMIKRVFSCAVAYAVGIGWLASVAQAQLEACDVHGPGSAEAADCQKAVYAAHLKVELGKTIDANRTELQAAKQLLLQVAHGPIQDPSGAEASQFYSHLRGALRANTETVQGLVRFPPVLVAMAAQAQANIDKDLQAVAEQRLDVATARQIILQELEAITDLLGLHVVEQRQAISETTSSYVRVRSSAQLPWQAPDCGGSMLVEPSNDGGRTYRCAIGDLDNYNYRYLSIGNVDRLLGDLQSGIKQIPQIAEHRLKHIANLAADLKGKSDSFYNHAMTHMPLARVRVDGMELGEYLLNDNLSDSAAASAMATGIDILMTNLASLEREFFTLTNTGNGPNERHMRATAEDAPKLTLLTKIRSAVLVQYPQFQSIDAIVIGDAYKLEEHQRRMESILGIATLGMLGVWGALSLFGGPVGSGVGLLLVEITGAAAAGYTGLLAIKRFQLHSMLSRALHSGIDEGLTTLATVSESWNMALRSLTWFLAEGIVTVVGLHSAFHGLTALSNLDMAARFQNAIDSLKSLARPQLHDLNHHWLLHVLNGTPGSGLRAGAESIVERISLLRSWILRDPDYLAGLLTHLFDTPKPSYGLQGLLRNLETSKTMEQLQSYAMFFVGEGRFSTSELKSILAQIQITAPLRVELKRFVSEIVRVHTELSILRVRMVEYGFNQAEVIEALNSATHNLWYLAIRVSEGASRYPGVFWDFPNVQRNLSVQTDWGRSLKSWIEQIESSDPATIAQRAGEVRTGLYQLTGQLGARTVSPQSVLDGFRDGFDKLDLNGLAETIVLAISGQVDLATVVPGVRHPQAVSQLARAMAAQISHLQYVLYQSPHEAFRRMILTGNELMSGDQNQVYHAAKRLSNFADQWDQAVTAAR